MKGKRQRVSELKKLAKPTGPVTTFRIKALATDETVHELNTTLTGPALEKVEAGLFAKIDFERFYVERLP